MPQQYKKSGGNAWNNKYKTSDKHPKFTGDIFIDPDVLKDMVLYAKNNTSPDDPENVNKAKVKVALSLSSLPEDLVEQRYDMSIRVAHALPDSNLRVKPLSSLEMILCAAPSYIENHSAPTIINDLIEHQCITSVNRHKELQTATWSFIQKKKTIKQKIIPHIEIDSIRAQIELVKLGRGIGRFPSMFVNSLIENGTLIPLLPKENLLPLRVFAMYPNAQFVPKKTRCFLGFMTTSALQVK